MLPEFYKNTGIVAAELVVTAKNPGGHLRMDCAGAVFLIHTVPGGHKLCPMSVR